MLVRAGERAASLAAYAEAQRAYERAIEPPTTRWSKPSCTSVPVSWRAGAHGPGSGRALRGVDRALRRRWALQHPALESRLAPIMWDRPRARGIGADGPRVSSALKDEPDDDLAELAAQLGRFMFFGGRHDVAMQGMESALKLAEDLALPEQACRP